MLSETVAVAGTGRCGAGSHQQSCTSVEVVVSAMRIVVTVLMVKRTFYSPVAVDSFLMPFLFEAFMAIKNRLGLAGRFTFYFADRF
jgi:hypothetical protein